MKYICWGINWSLAVEEQFYIFYPWIVKLTSNLLRNILIITIILLVAKTIFRVIDIKYGYSLPYQIVHVTRFQCMFIGGMGGYLYYAKNEIFLKISTHFISQIISWTAIILATFNSFHIASFLDNEIFSLITVFLITGQATKTNMIINLDNYICDFFGKLSYGIYVIHPLVIFLLSYIFKDLEIYSVAKYLLTYFSVFTLTIIISHVSYNHFEKRFLRLKNRYTIINSSGTKYYESKA